MRSSEPGFMRSYQPQRQRTLKSSEPTSRNSEFNEDYDPRQPQNDRSNPRNRFPTFQPTARADDTPSHLEGNHGAHREDQKAVYRDGKHCQRNPEYQHWPKQKPRSLPVQDGRFTPWLVIVQVGHRGTIHSYEFSNKQPFCLRVNASTHGTIRTFASRTDRRLV